jgi:hypothetical protein
LPAWAELHVGEFQNLLPIERGDFMLAGVTVKGDVVHDGDIQRRRRCEYHVCASATRRPSVRTNGLGSTKYQALPSSKLSVLRVVGCACFACSAELNCTGWLKACWEQIQQQTASGRMDIQ